MGTSHLMGSRGQGARGLEGGRAAMRVAVSAACDRQGGWRSDKTGHKVRKAGRIREVGRKGIENIKDLEPLLVRSGSLPEGNCSRLVN